MNEAPHFLSVRRIKDGAQEPLHSLVIGSSASGVAGARNPQVLRHFRIFVDRLPLFLRREGRVLQRRRRRRAVRRVTLEVIVVGTPDVVGVTDATFNLVFRSLAERRMSSVDNVLDGEAFGAFSRPHVEQLLAQRLDIERIAEVEELLKDKTN